jgi:N-acetylneuraminate synthase
MSESITVNGRRIGAGSPCFLIAEVAQAHDGSLGAAHAYIDAAAEAGVDAVKFQTHIADAESTLDEPFRIKFSKQDETRYAYWKRMEFSPEQWPASAAHAADKKLVFLSSAFSVAAVELLQKIGMAAWKVGSGEVGTRDLLDAMLAAGGADSCSPPA